MTDTRPDRLCFAFALRDPLPLEPGTKEYWFHNSACARGNDCYGEPGCRAGHVQFQQVTGVPDGLSRAVAGLLRQRPLAELLPLADVPVPEIGADTYALSTVFVHDYTTGAAIPQEAHKEAFRNVRRSVDGLRLATEALIPAFSSERVWPIEIVTEVLPDGTHREPTLLVDPRPNRFGPPEPADEDGLARASDFIAAAAMDDPVELQRDLELRSRTHLAEGDYLAAVVMAATASELLLKTLCSALVWEEVTERAGGTWTMSRGDLRRAFVSSQVKKVLPGALGPDWGWDSEGDLLWEWRKSLYELRNRVVHEGHRPTEEEAAHAVAALLSLTSTVVEQLRGRQSLFPRTTILLLGATHTERLYKLDFPASALIWTGHLRASIVADYRAWLIG